MRYMTGKQLLFRVVALSLGATGPLAIAILLFGEFDETAERILATTGALGFFSLLALPAGILLDEGRNRSLAVVTIALAASALVAVLWVIWGGGDETDAGWKVVATLTAFSGALSQISAGTSRRRGGDSRTVTRLYWFSVGAGFALAGLLATAAWGEVDETGYYRLVGALAVADVVALLLQPTLRRLGARDVSPTRLVVLFERTPSDEALAAALDALAPYGPRIERRA
jgi:hypothetical protein